MRDMDIEKILAECEEIVFKKSNRKAFNVSTKWSKQVTSEAGVYVFFKEGNIGNIEGVRCQVSYCTYTNTRSSKQSAGSGKRKLCSDLDFDRLAIVRAESAYCGYTQYISRENGRRGPHFRLETRL
jgi:hypothetical protein